MARFNLTVPEEKKEKWEKAAKEHPEAGGNLSALVRHSVEKEISNSNSEGSGSSEEVLTKLGELGDQLTEVTQRMESMESRLSSLESQSTGEPDIGDLTGEVFDLLPDKEPGTPEWKSERDELRDELEAIEEGLINGDSQNVRKSLYGWEGDTDGLSQALGEPEYMVQKAIDKLREDTHLVRSTDDGHYYKVD